ncbi:hypothetical protein SAMN05421774_11133 [Gemmobacter megaterium]|uniref:Glycosyltransferase family 10 (Fucosyltransferase) C-term n=1 Tax=Gemmobacter megaterium TaxID=1086013 RepID=A0A1N7QH72_9RHOB|nr:hypothetical protein [Gemmobacter megaterium]GGE26332.1 hypothetical protein GCM10011345_35350 [Gemmobacter megaterium]SIT22176.1 hypothetical protein SAMN05421774_11133 [Gemmobacter megaterium]
MRHQDPSPPHETPPELLSTRLFPKGAGAAAYVLSGIAARCDWAVLSDHKPPQLDLRGAGRTDSPRHVFLSLRAPFVALRGFHDRILPRIRGRFVLVSGSEDVTIPRQTDRRWRAFDAEERAMIAAIADDPRLVHWFAENLDSPFHPRVSALPLGLVTPAGAAPPPVPARVPAFAARDPRAFCCHRLREGPQWQNRHRTSALARTAWADVCVHQDEGLDEAAYRAALHRHAFAICVEGGGLDPSPKAWEALLADCIPILRRTATSAAYRDLPVAYVEDWTPDCLDRDRLRHWAADLSPFVDDPALRAGVLEKLTLRHWWARIAACAET